MAILVNIKTKKQEKAVKNFLNELDIEFQTLAGEDAAPYKTAPGKSLTPKEKKILSNLDQSVDFVNKYERGKTKAKSLKQLLNEL
ncbi:MAG TPA: hypothetical protein VF487_01845 [Chitinophagaceae bacterium]